MNETRHPVDAITTYGLCMPIVRREVVRGAEVVTVRCPLCSREMAEHTASTHVEKHQARDAKAASKAALRDLGAIAKPLPGQLGLSIGGRR